MWQLKTITSNIFKRRTIFIDNFIFRCYYRGCFWILVVSSSLLCLKQYFGDHIHCLASKHLKNVINTFCYFSTTFTVVKHHYSKQVAHPGVGPVQDDDEVIYHAYYQWVPFLLFLQAMGFYIPHLIWKIKERKRISKWVEFPQPKEDISLRLSVYRDWSRWLITCEILNSVNLILQIYLTDLFLQGKFLDLGFNYRDLETVFPKVTKCTWRQYGPSGTLQKHDALCIVANNVINEKIFIVLWYWYIILSFFTIWGLLWRLATLIFHGTRWFNRFVFSTLGTGANLQPYQSIRIARYTDYFEWLLLYYLGKNLKHKEFQNAVSGLGPQPETPKEDLKSQIPSTPKPKERNKLYPDLDGIDKNEEVNLLDGPVPSAPKLSTSSIDPEESDC